MPATKAVIAASVIGISGCSAKYAEPPLPENHPANPAAPSAPIPARSRTLDRVDPVVPEAADTGAHHHHTAPGTPPADTHALPPQEPAGPAGQPSADASAAYTCPMHPEVVSTEPGRCPKCGMALVKKPDGARQP